MATAGHPEESQALGGSGRGPVEPFTLYVSQTFANQGIVTQAFDGLDMTPHPSAVPPAPLLVPQASAALFMPPRLLVLLRWPYRPLSQLRSSLRLRVGLRLPPPTRLCLLRACATPPGSTVLHVSVLCRMVLRWPSVPIIEPCLFISCSVYYYGSS